MAKILSMDLRSRAIGAVEGGMSCRRAAAHFGVAPSTVIRWRSRQSDTGSFEARRRGRKAGLGLDAHRDLVLSICEANMDATLMEMLDRHELRGSISLNVAMCQHCPEIIEACVERKWEFFSHGIYNTRYSYEMDEAQERAVLEDSIATVQAATGQRIRGYLAPALTHTERTLDLIADYDFWYTCDLFQDDQPQPIKTKTGKLMSMPYSLEVNDVITYGALAMSAERYADVLMRHFDQLLEEGDESGTVMCIPLHAYLVSQSHRIKAFERALSYITSHKDEVWFTTAAEIAGHYREHCWDQTLADVAARGLATGGTGFS